MTVINSNLVPGALGEHPDFVDGGGSRRADLSCRATVIDGFGGADGLDRDGFDQEVTVGRDKAEALLVLCFELAQHVLAVGEVDQ